MIDVHIDSVGKFQVSDTVVFKAKNIMETQEGSLNYAPDLGIDLKTFLDPDIKIQNETFEAYSLRRLSEQGVNPIALAVDPQALQQIFNYKVIEATTDGLIAR